MGPNIVFSNDHLPQGVGANYYSESHLYADVVYLTYNWKSETWVPPRTFPKGLVGELGWKLTENQVDLALLDLDKEVGFLLVSWDLYPLKVALIWSNRVLWTEANGLPTWLGFKEAWMTPTKLTLWERLLTSV